MTEPDPKPGVALAGASLAIVIWGIGPLFVRAISVSSLTTAAYRMAMATPLMVGIAYATGGRLTWPILKRTIPHGALFALVIVTSFAPLQKTSIVNATLIASLSPALVMLVAGRLFNDRPSPSRIAWALVAFVGVFVVVLGAESGGSASL